jgi:hypothetical protein
VDAARRRVVAEARLVKAPGGEHALYQRRSVYLKSFRVCQSENTVAQVERDPERFATIPRCPVVMPPPPRNLGPRVALTPAVKSSGRPPAQALGA